MKSFIIILAALLTGSITQAEEVGFFQYKSPGYTKTVFIPGSSFRVHQDDRPQPPRVIPATRSPETKGLAPSDATKLFDGQSLSQFQQTSWAHKADVLTAGKGNLITKKAYGSCQLHMEWRTPNPAQGKPNNMGNSGIFFMGLYELQIYDSFSSKIYADGMAAAIYGQTPPLVNACDRPGQWQSYDVIFIAPVFKEGKLVEEAKITVFFNGVLVHHNTKILGPTAHKTSRPYKAHAARLPLMIQGHDSPVEFRNIWIRDLNSPDHK